MCSDNVYTGPSKKCLFYGVTLFVLGPVRNICYL